MLLQTNPKAGYLAYKEEIDRAVSRVLKSGWYILGEEVAAFEREFAEYMGANHAIGVATGTDALILALKACGIGAGDGVITVAHTAVATVTAIELAGATPILADIDPVTFTLAPNSLEDTIRYCDRQYPEITLKAIIPVHIYGHSVDITAILNIAHRYNLEVIEDCAQSHGATFKERKTGTWGKLGTFSFYPTKNLGALGDGGAIITNDSQLAETLMALRQYGWRQKFVSDLSGMNSRLDPIQAAILRVKLAYLDRDNQQRRNIADIYHRNLSQSGLELPQISPEIEPVYHQYVVRSHQRNQLQTRLKEQGIGTAIHYPIPVHQQPAYRHLPLAPDGLTVTEKMSQEILSLPMYGQLSDGQAEEVSQAVLASLQSLDR
ncbi:DegT/DnrJ/EryC1/StrS family aminotransferase [Roseofilum casamattae]|uniref:DegT/DnrJ/EryC1/StrS family aminotransferase n=1 Tax=Roseofilum casamattae BLCC-M143 TaxID=3022442 RepID=A0ABT7BUI4_9CYAN|nr:DegT/DnrJ/EryC1/StrS family aminotransferase [Roseofilum casamattae]MDJ1182179.1 DegT/DnrJ/EryC1/StrS family aminotransferase [Roseofilum casamattae BLCC-M143]